MIKIDKLHDPDFHMDRKKCTNCKRAMPTFHLMISDQHFDLCEDCYQAIYRMSTAVVKYEKDYIYDMDEIYPTKWW